MKSWYRPFFILLFLSLNLTAISQGSYLTFEDVQFNSAIEEKIIKGLLDGDSDPFDGFLAIASEDSASFEKWKAFYSNEIEQLKGRKIPKKVEKDVKNIYDQLHEKFLRKYNYLAYFDQIFEEGVYNCVTAVALYAMSFDELGIPYSIKETPTHVYIIADPGESQLLIETTDPVSGFKSFSPGFRENFVSQLAMMKLVDQADVATKGIYPIFDDFYFGGDDLSLKQLVGIQYYNQGVDLFENKDYEGAWTALSKAQLFHSGEQLDGLLFASIISMLSGSDYSEWRDIKLLPYLTKFTSFDVKETNILGEFARMLNFVLWDRNDSDMAEKAFNHFIKNSDNEKANKEVTFHYYYEIGRQDYNRANFKEAFKSMKKAYAVKPGNANAELLLTESFRISYRNKQISEALEEIESLMSENEELQTNNHLNSLRLNLYLAQMAEDFESRKPENGSKMKDVFESYLTAKPDASYDKYVLANAYSKAAVYYFKRGYTTKARSIIQKGLSYAPDNYELKSRLRMINR